VLGGAVMFGLTLIAVRPHDVLVAESPDGAHCVVVRERVRHIDRNFYLVLVDQAAGKERVLYRSQDQKPTIKQERFVWSDDSSKVVLLGDKYFVHPESMLPSGEIVFLLYDLETDQVWCNEDHDQGYPRIAPREVLEIFGERLEME
jgi:hypothetical protein